MAFSVSAFANIVQVKEEVVVTNTKVTIIHEVEDNTPPKDCFSIGINAYNSAYNQNLYGDDEWAYVCIMNIAIALCEGYTYEQHQGC